MDKDQFTLSMLESAMTRISQNNSAKCHICGSPDWAFIVGVGTVACEKHCHSTSDSANIAADEYQTQADGVDDGIST